MTAADTQQCLIQGWYIEKLCVHSIYLCNGDPTNWTPAVLEIFIWYGSYTNRKSSKKFQVYTTVKTLETTCSRGDGNYRCVEHTIQKTRALCSSKMMATTLQITQCHNPQDTMNKIICLQTTKILILVWCIQLRFRLQLNIRKKNPLTQLFR